MSTTPSSTARSLLAINIAVAGFGLAGPLGVLTGLPAPLITLGRVAFAGAALALVSAIRRLPLAPHRPRDAALLIAQGLLLALHWTAFFQAIAVSSVAIGVLAYSTFPLFTAAFEPLLLRQRPGALQSLAALATLPGVYLLIPALSLRNADTRGVLWGLLAGATFALLSVLNRWLGRGYPSVTISLYQETAALLALLPTLWLVPAALPRLAHPQHLLLLAALGLGCTALAHTLFIEGLRASTAQRASLLAALEPVWGILWGLVLLSQAPSPRTLLGGGVILAAALAPSLATTLAQRIRPTPTANRPA